MTFTPLLNHYLLPSIHPSYARLLAAHARNQGVDMEELFKGSSLDWNALLKSPSFVSFEQFKRVVKNAELLTGNDHLELDISSMSQASSHGPLGYGALAAPTVRETFELVQRMLATRITIISLELVEGEQHTRFRVTPTFDLGELSVFVTMMLLGSFLDLITKTTGDSTTELLVRLPFDSLDKEADYAEKFPQVQFELGHAALEVVMPQALMNQPSLTADDFAYRNALRECEQLLRQAGNGGAFARRVKTYLINHCDSLPNQEALASIFAVSVRTFIRKLKTEGTSYQALLDEVRKELVVWYLSDTSLSVDEIANLVGYADTSNFSRVFRRWFDQTPSEFRKLNQLT